MNKRNIGMVNNKSHHPKDSKDIFKFSIISPIYYESILHAASFPPYFSTAVWNTYLHAAPPANPVAAPNGPLTMEPAAPAPNDTPIQAE